VTEKEVETAGVVEDVKMPACDCKDDRQGSADSLHCCVTLLCGGRELPAEAFFVFFFALLIHSSVAAAWYGNDM
jgi:hypothetical protein